MREGMIKAAKDRNFVTFIYYCKKMKQVNYSRNLSQDSVFRGETQLSAATHRKNPKKKEHHQITLKSECEVPLPFEIIDSWRKSQTREKITVLHNVMIFFLHKIQDP